MRRVGLRRVGSRRSRDVSAAREHPHGSHLPLRQYREHVSRAILDKWDQAAVFYDKALKESPQSPAAHFGRAMLLAAEASIPRTRLRTTEQRWRDGPTTPNIHLNLALALAAVGDARRARSIELNAAAGASPRRPDRPTSSPESCCSEQSRPGDAWKAFERALAIQPKNLDALLGSGVALEQLQRVNDAATRFREALDVDPRNTEAQKGLERANAARSGRDK